MQLLRMDMDILTVPRVSMMLDNVHTLERSDIDAVKSYAGSLDDLGLPDRFYVEMFRLVPKSVVNHLRATVPLPLSHFTWFVQVYAPTGVYHLPSGVCSRGRHR